MQLYYLSGVRDYSLYNLSRFNHKQQGVQYV
nr:MAG TPA: hypothetical protein [Caudoviricetes sp.]